MKERFSGVPFGLFLLGNFAAVSLAQTQQEQCDAYTVCANKDGFRIENVFFGLRIIFDSDTRYYVLKLGQPTRTSSRSP